VTRRVIADQSYTVGLPSGAGPAAIVIPQNPPDIGDCEVTAWIGNFGSSNAYLFGGGVPLTECQSRLANDVVGTIDCIMALSASGPTTMSTDKKHSMTVFFESQNTSGQTQTVTVRVLIYV
jgi:hypothetical protein